MRVISRKRLRDFAGQHPDAQSGLDSWFHEAEEADWRTPAEVKHQYAGASVLKHSRVVFDIGGTKYRLVVKINYAYRVVSIRFIGTHQEYDKIEAETI
jgi:mRNA interferase HigB